MTAADILNQIDLFLSTAPSRGETSAARCTRPSRPARIAPRRRRTAVSDHTRMLNISTHIAEMLTPEQMREIGVSEGQDVDMAVLRIVDALADRLSAPAEAPPGFWQCLCGCFWLDCGPPHLCAWCEWKRKTDEQIDKMRARFTALVTYVRHRQGCASTWPGESQIGPCDCGLAAAVSDAGAGTR